MTDSLASLLGLALTPTPAPAAAPSLLGGGLLGAAPAAAPAPAPAPAPAAGPAPSPSLGGLLGAAPAAAPAPSPSLGGLLGAAPAAAPQVAVAPQVAAALAPNDDAIRAACRDLAKDLFSKGAAVPPGAHALIHEEYAALVAKAQVNPPDAAPATGPLLGVPVVEQPALPAAPEPVIAPAPSKRGRKAAAAAAAVVATGNSIAVTDTGSADTGSPIALLEAALDAARAERNFRLCARVANLLDAEQAEA